MKTVIELNPSVATGYLQLAEMHLITGEVNKARALLVNNQHIDDQGMYIMRGQVELLDRNYQEAIGILESSPYEVVAGHGNYTPKPVQLGLIYYVMADKELASSHFG